MTLQKKYLTTKEYSSISGIPVSSLRRLLREGKLEAIKSSGKWMIPESQLQPKDIQETEKSDLVKKVLGEHIFNKFIENKKIEWDRYRTHVSKFELDHYLPTL